MPGLSNALSLVGDWLVGQKGEISTGALQETEVVALYFSASWCGACEDFSPKVCVLRTECGIPCIQRTMVQLIEIYQTLQKALRSFEIVWASQERLALRRNSQLSIRIRRLSLDHP
jgi:thiol-disulfide isomerase/thioredoxin